MAYKDAEVQSGEVSTAMIMTMMMMIKFNNHLLSACSEFVGDTRITKIQFLLSGNPKSNVKDSLGEQICTENCTRNPIGDIPSVQLEA